MREMRRGAGHGFRKESASAADMLGRRAFFQDAFIAAEDTLLFALFPVRGCLADFTDDRFPWLDWHETHCGRREKRADKIPSGDHTRAPHPYQ